MRWEIVRDLETLRGVEPEWRELYARSGASFTMSPTWLGAWWRSMRDAPVDPFGRRKLLAVLVRDAEGALRGIAAFCRRWAREGLTPRVRLDALGTGENKEDEVCSDYVTLLACRADGPAVATAAIEALLGEHAGRWDEIVLPTMRRDDPMLEPLVAAAVVAGLDVRAEVTARATFAALPGTYDAFLGAMPGKRRYAVKRTLSDFEAWAAPRGGVVFRRVDRADLDRGLETLVELHAARWGTRHVFTSARFRAFHDEVMRAMISGLDARLDLWILSAGATPIGALYNVVQRGVVHQYQSGRRTDLPRGVKPGMVANVLAIRHAIEEGHAEYDFLPGEARYKDQLGTGHHDLVTVRLARTDARAVALDLLAQVSRRAALSLSRRLGRGGPAAPETQ